MTKRGNNQPGADVSEGTYPEFLALLETKSGRKCGSPSQL